jgi:hypothetical protein
MNLYHTERDRILGLSKPAWFKSMLLRLQGLDADDAFVLLAPFCPSRTEVVADRRSITNLA